jgi:chromosome segregation ATPase
MMNQKIKLLLFAWPLMILLLVACQATVPQEEHDLVLADLSAAEAEVQRLESELTTAQNELGEAQGQINDLQQELDALQNQGTDAEIKLRELQAKAEEAVLAAEMLDALVKAAFGAEDLTDADAMQLFLELSNKVEASDDAVLQEKFQAVVLSFGGEQEAIELVQYLIEVIGELGASS